MKSISEFNHKNIRIRIVDGAVYEGFATDYMSEADNAPNPACISIGDIEFLKRISSRLNYLEGKQYAK